MTHMFQIVERDAQKWGTQHQKSKYSSTIYVRQHIEYSENGSESNYN